MTRVTRTKMSSKHSYLEALGVVRKMKKRAHVCFPEPREDGGGPMAERGHETELCPCKAMYYHGVR